MDIKFVFLGLLLLQTARGQFFPQRPPGIPGPFPPFAPPAFDQAAADEKYQPGKCLTANVTSNLQEFGRCVREIIDTVASSEGARTNSFQQIYELLSFRLFGQPPVVSFEQPQDCRRMIKSGDRNLFVRLVGLNGEINRNKGRVQVSQDNVHWGSICDDSWDERDAEVVCKMLRHSYNSNSRKPIAIGGGASFPGASQPGPFGLSAYMCTVMDAVDCYGWESNLGQCGWINNSPSRCTHYEDAAVDCNPDQEYREFNTRLYRDSRSECLVSHDRNRRAREQPDVQVRLVNGKQKGNTVVSGRVEVQTRQGRWGSVCDDDFDDDDAAVICRQIGSQSEDRRRKPRAFLSGAFGTMEPSDCISLDDMHCTGSESNINKCYHSGPTGHNCQHNEDAAVDCNTFPYDVELINVVRSSESGYVMGVLSVSNDDKETYGAVTDCVDFPVWNDNATEVVLKGLRNVPRDCTAVWVTDQCIESFSRAQPPTPLMHQVMCNRTARDLGMCEFQPGIAAYNACPSWAIGLFCTSSGMSLPSQCFAVGSPMNPMGMMQFGAPGFVPNNTFAPGPAFGSPFPPFGGGPSVFGGPAPSVFPTFNQINQSQGGGPPGFRGASPPGFAPFQPGFQQGFQPGLQQGQPPMGFGSSLQWTLSGCQAARCQSGVLQVGTPPIRPWGTVCKDGDFTDNPERMARLVCKWINPEWTIGEVVPASNFPPIPGLIGMDDLKCEGRAQTLASCTYSPWGAHNCDQSKNVALVCGSSPSDLRAEKERMSQRSQAPRYPRFQPPYPNQFGFGNVQG